jgi:hypothetical protein
MEDINNPAQVRASVEEKNGIRKGCLLGHGVSGLSPRDAKSSRCGNKFQLAITAAVRRAIPRQ